MPVNVVRRNDPHTVGGMQRWLRYPVLLMIATVIGFELFAYFVVRLSVRIYEAVIRQVSSLMKSERRNRGLYTQLRRANSYHEYLNLARQLDDAKGLNEWRDQDESELYDSELVAEILTMMRTCKDQSEWIQLSDLLTEVITHCLPWFEHEELYAHCFFGTKHLVTDFLRSTVECMNALCDSPESFDSDPSMPAPPSLVALHPKMDAHPPPQSLDFHSQRRSDSDDDDGHTHYVESLSISSIAAKQGHSNHHHCSKSSDCKSEENQRPNHRHHLRLSHSNSTHSLQELKQKLRKSVATQPMSLSVPSSPISLNADDLTEMMLPSSSFESIARSLFAEALERRSSPSSRKESSSSGVESGGSSSPDKGAGLSYSGASSSSPSLDCKSRHRSVFGSSSNSSARKRRRRRRAFHQRKKRMANRNASTIRELHSSSEENDVMVSPMKTPYLLSQGLSSCDDRLDSAVFGNDDLMNDNNNNHLNGHPNGRDNNNNNNDHRNKEGIINNYSSIRNGDFINAADSSYASSSIVRMPRFLSLDEKIRVFSRLYSEFGTTALCLSGGATMTFFQFGVIRELICNRMMPAIISGTSGGSLVAAMVCTRTDEELIGYDPSDCASSLDDQRRGFLTAESLEQSVRPFDNHGSYFQMFYRWFFDQRHGCFLDYNVWTHGLREQLKQDMTFLEAFKHSKRVLNISVVNNRHKNLLLNYKKTPHIVVWSAVIASSSLPPLMKASPLVWKCPRTGVLKVCSDTSTDPTTILFDEWLSGLNKHGSNQACNNDVSGLQSSSSSYSAGMSSLYRRFGMNNIKKQGLSEKMDENNNDDDCESEDQSLKQQCLHPAAVTAKAAHYSSNHHHNHHHHSRRRRSNNGLRKRKNKHDHHHRSSKQDVFHQSRLSTLGVGKYFVDGSISMDLPIFSLMKDFNARKCFAVQCNPHVFPWFYDVHSAYELNALFHPFGYSRLRGGFVCSLLERLLKLELKKWMKIIADLNLMPMILGNDWRMTALQESRGHHTIIPRPWLSDFVMLCTNPSLQRWQHYMDHGRQMALEWMQLIEHRMNVAHSIKDCLMRLKRRKRDLEMQQYELASMAAIAMSSPGNSNDHSQNQQQQQQDLEGELLSEGFVTALNRARHLSSQT